MKIYEVGGAVRDRLLGLEPKDIDYVIVGATQEDIKRLEAEGYQQVGVDFPVFLHPVTGDEYALARTERKTGVGYAGFSCETENVTLEEDLLRRDLKINAMARDLETGEIIDPYGGREDLQDGYLVHTSPAFAEDPVRVLRTARFAARYGFTIAPHTMKLMGKIAHELVHVPKERIWTEFEKGMKEQHAVEMFNALYECGAMKCEALLPYSKVNYGAMEKTNSATPLHVKVTLATRGFTDQDFIDQCIPSHFARASKLFNRNFDSVVFYYAKTPEQRVDILTAMRAFSSPELMNEALETFDIFSDFVYMDHIGKGVKNTTRLEMLSDLDKIRQRVDAKAIADADPKHVKQNLFNARVAAIS